MIKKNIITGQQIGLLGGPLYTTYKVLGAISIAKDIDGNAIYWLETNDADFSEINRIDYLDRSGELQTLRWDIDSKGFSCGYILVDKKLINILNTFFSTIHQTEYTKNLREVVLDCYKIGKTLGEGSKALAKKMFGRYDLIIFDPSEKKFRDFSKKILLKEAEKEKNRNQCNFFCLENKIRKAVFKKNNNFYFRDGKKIQISNYDLLPNVKTRNLCQDAYFNTHTYIAGPGEIKYIEGLDELYKYHKVKKSNVKPRMSVSLIEPRIKKLLKKTGLTTSDIDAKSREQILKDELIAFSGFDKKKISENLNRSINSLLKSFKLEGIEPVNLKKILQMETKKLIGEKRKKIKIDFENEQKNIELIINNLKPFGKKQERVFNIFYYMNLYGGIDFVDFLLKNYCIKKSFLEINNG